MTHIRRHLAPPPGAALLACLASLALAVPAAADIDVSRLLSRERPATPAAAASPTPARASATSDAVTDPDAMYARALAHDQAGTAEDLVEAARWYRMAAERGHVDAQVNLGVMLSQGQGIARDDAEAARWFTRAAEAGSARGHYSLGLMYYHGTGVEQDFGTALELYEAAASGGYSSAMNNLGIMYGLGEGVDRDDASAYAWFALAALLGDPNAAKNRDLTADELSAADLERGQDRFFELKEAMGLR